MKNKENMSIQENAKFQRQLFGERLRALRKNAGFTQQQLAKRSGFTASVIARYEAGGSLPRPQALEKLAAALGVPVSDLDGSNFDLDLNVLLSKNIAARLKKCSIHAEFKDTLRSVTLSGPDIDNKTLPFDDLRKVIEKTDKEVKELLAPLFDKYFNDLLKVNLKVCDSDDSLREREPEVIAKIKKVYELTKGQ